jgi:CubicO group peptidase (beta-lactamase class C family)
MPEIERRAEKAINEGVFPGCVIGVLSGGETEIFSCGTVDGTVPVTDGTIYDLASITKSIPLASLALLLADEGVISLGEKATTYIGELRDEYGATLEDLLRYRVRGPRMSTLATKTFEEIRTHILESGFDGPPGDRAYANAPAFVLGVALERATGEILPALADRYFFQPLRMDDTTFFPHDAQRCAPTEMVQGAAVRGVVHDESARIFAESGRAVGHAGLFSTAADLLLFARALIEGTFSAVARGAIAGLGWQADEPHFMGSLASPSAFGKTGFTGTSIVIDTDRERALVILSNRTYPARPHDTDAINAFRRDIADIVYAAVH